MTTLTPGASPLGQALARKRSSPLPALLLGLGLIVAVAFAALGYLESRRTELVVILARDVPYGHQITAEDLTTVAMPLHRPAQLAGITESTAAIGFYAGRHLHADAILQPVMLLAEPPDQPIFPNGAAVVTNMVPLPFSTASIGPLTAADRVNIGYSDPAGAPDLCDDQKSATAAARPTVGAAASPLSQPRPFACRLLSSVRVLYVDAEAGVAYLELTPYQAHAIRALQAAGLELWGERFGAGSEALPSLDRLDIGQVSREQLDAPPADDSTAPAERP